MSRQTSPRHIDTSHARPAGRRVSHSRAAGAAHAGAQRPPVHGHSSGTSVTRSASAARNGSAGRSASGSAHSGPAHAGAARRTSSAPYASAAPRRTGKRRRRKRRSAGKTFLRVLLCVVLVLGVAFGGLYWYVSSLFNVGEMGQLAPAQSGAEDLVPDELTGTMNILVLGIDYSSEDAVERDPIGQTDMILYVRVDGSAHSMMMLQIPRDTLVGQIGGSAGKINGIFANSADTENRVNTLAQYITGAFGLPIDDYVTIDMDSLREIVDRFGGLEVYIPVSMEYAGSRLEQGWRTLDGNACEFFLRQRKDASATPRGDIDRLANQQYFYSALFRRVRTATVGDIIKLTPVVQYYVNTSLNFVELVQLGMSVLTIPSANITIGRLPVARGELYNGMDVMVCAKAETAEFLNEYLRPASEPISASQIGTPDWPVRSEVIGAEVRRMGEVDAAGGGEAGAPEDAAQAAAAAAAAAQAGADVE